MPSVRGKPDQALQIAEERVLDVEMHAAGVALLQQEDARGEQGGKHHAHGGPGLNAPEPLDRLDQDGGHEWRLLRRLSSSARSKWSR